LKRSTSKKKFNRAAQFDGFINMTSHTPPITKQEEAETHENIGLHLMVIQSDGTYKNKAAYKKKLRTAVSWEQYCETKEYGETDITGKEAKTVGCDCCGHKDANKLVDDLFGDHLNFLCMACYIRFVIKKDTPETKALMLQWHMTGAYPNPNEQ